MGEDSQLLALDFIYLFNRSLDSEYAMHAT